MTLRAGTVMVVALALCALLGMVADGTAAPASAPCAAPARTSDRAACASTRCCCPPARCACGHLSRCTLDDRSAPAALLDHDILHRAWALVWGPPTPLVATGPRDAIFLPAGAPAAPDLDRPKRPPRSARA